MELVITLSQGSFNYPTSTYDAIPQYGGIKALAWKGTFNASTSTVYGLCQKGYVAVRTKTALSHSIAVKRQQTSIQASKLKANERNIYFGFSS